jgi:hypothetical protein
MKSRGSIATAAFAVSCCLIVLAVLALAPGCAGKREPPAARAGSPPVEVPDHFLIGSTSGTEMTEPGAGEGCRSPMVDPRDGTKLKLARSYEGQGDYEVPDGKYGVGKGDLLRVECATGRAVGIVKR